MRETGLLASLRARLALLMPPLKALADQEASGQPYELDCPPPLQPSRERDRAPVTPIAGRLARRGA